MSNYKALTKHPGTSEWEIADWIDNYFGPHRYGVKFVDSDFIYNPEVHDLEVKKEKYDNDEKNNPLINSLANTFDNCLIIATKKNADYSPGADPFRNFRNSEVIGVDPERAILVRVTDKITRIGNLIGRTDGPVVTDETINDTIEDAINYLAILKALRENDSKRN